MASPDLTAALSSLDDAYLAAAAEASGRQSAYQDALAGDDVQVLSLSQVRRDQSRALMRGIARAQDAIGQLV